ncbi:MAG: hypothetical protein LBM69_04005, partial [Lachnospiraceae bacterium]|nr:hypothetical protein [Lachnospiraceae bacterium]
IGAQTGAGLKVRELSNSLFGTRAIGAQTGAGLKVRELSNSLISTRAVGAQTGACLKVRELSNSLIGTRAVGAQTGAKYAFFEHTIFVLLSTNCVAVLFCVLSITAYMAPKYTTIEKFDTLIF